MSQNTINIIDANSPFGGLRGLIIAEKPSVARAIAHVLGISGQQDGYIGNFNSGTNTVVTWAIGHLVVRP